eukprot:gene7500-5285_t
MDAYEWVRDLDPREGQIALVRRVSDGLLFVRKRVMSFMRDELNALRRLHHPHIISLVDTIEEEAPYLYFILEYCARGDLRDAMSSLRGLPFSAMELNDLDAGQQEQHRQADLQCVALTFVELWEVNRRRRSPQRKDEAVQADEKEPTSRRGSTHMPLIESADDDDDDDDAKDIAAVKAVLTGMRPSEEDGLIRLRVVLGLPALKPFLSFPGVLRLDSASIIRTRCSRPAQPTSERGEGETDVGSHPTHAKDDDGDDVEMHNIFFGSSVSSHNSGDSMTERATTAATSLEKSEGSGGQETDAAGKEMAAEVVEEEPPCPSATTELMDLLRDGLEKHTAASAAVIDCVIACVQRRADLFLCPTSPLHLCPRHHRRPLLHQLTLLGRIPLLAACLTSPLRLDFTRCDSEGFTVLHLLPCGATKSAADVEKLLTLLLDRIEAHPSDRIQWDQGDNWGRPFLVFATNWRRLPFVFPLLRQRVPFFRDATEPISISCGVRRSDWAKLAAEDQNWLENENDTSLSIYEGNTASIIIIISFFVSFFLLLLGLGGPVGAPDRSGLNTRSSACALMFMVSTLRLEKRADNLCSINKQIKRHTHISVDISKIHLPLLW